MPLPRSATLPRVRWLAVAAALAAFAVVALHYHARPRRLRPWTRVAVPLDVDRLHAQVAERRIAAQRLPHRATHAPVTSLSGAALRKQLGPRCMLGPAEVCAAVADSVEACIDGDADTCAAVATYLLAAPPYPFAAMFFQRNACRLGDAASCAPVTVAGDAQVDCDREPLVCVGRARRAHDVIGLDQACTRGVAHACALLAMEFDDQPATSQAYLTAGCQAGDTFLCAALAQRLAPDCREGCYAADPVQARQAATIACDAGDAGACRLATL